MLRHVIRKAHRALIKFVVGRSSVAINVDLIDGVMIIKEGHASFAAGCIANSRVAA